MNEDKEPPKVGDLFCGAGGFSEGFRQKGFELVYGLDHWGPAIETSKYNHPGTNFDEKDILEIEIDDFDDYMYELDVIIASPPCVSFSRSNKMGKADKSDGVKLIKKTLAMIAWLKEHGDLKYWVVENVPNTAKHIDDTYGWDSLGLPGEGEDLKVKRKEIYNSENFGVPQRRKRVFFGEFPSPVHNGSEGIITVEDVFSNLGNPLKERDDIAKDKIKDPCYPELEVKVSELTDHFYDTTVRRERWERAKELKEDARYMGKMSFPDDVDRPSRTVMATRSASSREAMLFNASEEEEEYRLPTVREIATFMSFPITYQFQGKSETEKYRLVGNAVPCKLSAAIAEGIAKDLGFTTRESFIPIEQNGTLKKDLTATEPSLRKLGKRKSSFARHIDYLKERSFRVEIDNLDSNFEENDIRWESVLHKGKGYKHRKETKYSKESLDELKKEGLSSDSLESFSIEGVDWKLFEQDLSEILDGRLSSPDDFLEVYVHRREGLGPRKVLRELKDIIDDHFPEEKYEGLFIENKGVIDMDVEKIPVRIVAGMIACKFVTDKVNSFEEG